MPKTTNPKAPGAPQRLGFLQASAKLMKAEEIADELGYKSAEGIEAVQALLEELVGQGRLLKNRRGGLEERWYSNEVPGSGLVRRTVAGRVVSEVIEWGAETPTT